MLIEESHKDVPTAADGNGNMRNPPSIESPTYRTVTNRVTHHLAQQASSSSTPESQTTQEPASLAWSSSPKSIKKKKTCYIATLYPTDAYSFLRVGLTVTGPVSRFARQIAGHGYIVAAPSSYHEFTGPEPLAYDGPGTDEGNDYKIKKKVSAYDEDAELSVSLLLDLPTCNGRVGTTGMCLGTSSSSSLPLISIPPPPRAFFLLPVRISGEEQ
ncbi:MAG: hypothetical protein Q9194_004801 [Teloschistes cf. exilis]